MTSPQTPKFPNTIPARDSNLGHHHPHDDKVCCNSSSETIETTCAKYSIEQKRKDEGFDVDENLLFHQAFRIGQSFQRRKQFEVSLDYYRQALLLKNKTILKESRDAQVIFSDILYHVGTIHVEEQADCLHWKEKSLDSFNLCLDFRLICFGPSHYAVAEVLHKLGTLYSSMDEHSHALDLLLESLSILLKTSPDTEELKAVWVALGKTHKALGQYDDARSSFQEAELMKIKPSNHQP
jgi:tetratricopeptide (TPR) repeat protein